MKQKVIYLLLLFIISVSCTDKEKETQKYLNSALVKIDNSDFDGALNDLNKAIELSPKNFKLYFTRGNTYFNKQQYNNAIADYDKAIALNEKYTDAYFNRGNTYQLLNNNDKACADYITAYKLGKPNIKTK